MLSVDYTAHHLSGAGHFGCCNELAYTSPITPRGRKPRLREPITVLYPKSCNACRTWALVSNPFAN